MKVLSSVSRVDPYTFFFHMLSLEGQCSSKPPPQNQVALGGYRVCSPCGTRGASDVTDAHCVGAMISLWSSRGRLHRLGDVASVGEGAVCFTLLRGGGPNCSDLALARRNKTGRRGGGAGFLAESCCPGMGRGGGASMMLDARAGRGAGELDRSWRLAATSRPWRRELFPEIFGTHSDG